MRNLPGTTVLISGAIAAGLQYLIDSNTTNSHTVNVVLGAVLTILVAVHGALTNSVLSNKLGGRHAATADALVSEGEVIVSNVQQDLGEK